FKTEVETALAQLIRQGRPQVVIEAAQQLRAAMNQRHFGAKAVENAGELNRNISAADDDHAARQTVEMESLIRGDSEIAPGNFRLGGPTPGRGQNIFAREAPPINRKGVRIDDFR